MIKSPWVINSVLVKNIQVINSRFQFLIICYYFQTLLPFSKEKYVMSKT